MKSNYIPEILKEKLSSIYNFIYFLSLLLVSIISGIALLTFDINDNSFLTSTNTQTGNLLGDFGECVAIEHYGLKKADSGASGYDAIDQDGKTVQIKANYASKTIGIRGEADLLLVIKVKVDGTWEELYFDNFEKALSIANFSKRDNKHSISITALKKIK